MTLSKLSVQLGRTVLWISRIQKKFALPVLEDYSAIYETFLRKFRDLRNLGVSEEKLTSLWDLERKLIEILHLDPGGGELSQIEGCSAEADPDRRQMLSNADLGVPLMALDVQAGLDFQSRPRELFEGKAMGEDALHIFREYRCIIQEVSEIVKTERKFLSESLRWKKSIGIVPKRFTGLYDYAEEKIHS